MKSLKLQQMQEAGCIFINEDPENGRNGAFWGVAKQRTLNILQTTMINYSIVMRSVNANLLEINQAKSRINQAKKEGTTPDPKDLELVKTLQAEKPMVEKLEETQRRLRGNVMVRTKFNVLSNFFEITKYKALGFNLNSKAFFI